MPIQPGAAPADGGAIVESLLAANVMRQGRATAIPTVSEPLPVYALDLHALSSSTESALGDARLIAWRYLVLTKRPAMVADVSPAGSASLVRGGGVARNLAGACAAAEEACASGADYEPRVLDVGLIGQPVLWLRSLDPAHPDRFLSLRQPSRELFRPALLKKWQRRATTRIPSVMTRGGEGGG